MSAAGWVRWVLAAAMLAVALYHLARLARLVRARRRGGIDVEVAHAAMGTTMASMLVGAPAAALLPVLFAGAGCWFVVRTVRGYVLAGSGTVARPAQASVGCVAMVVMLGGSVGVSSEGSMGASMPSGAMAMPAADLRSVGIVIVVATVALAGWTVSRWRQQQCAGPAARLALGCQLAMNVTTVAMLALR